MQSALSQSDLQFLSASNPRLRILIEEYKTLHYFDQGLWETWRDRIDLVSFRREGDYLSQMEYGMSEGKYWATLGYVAAQDDQNYLSLFTEDDLFGAIPFRIGELNVTRDLLDSILEINFLRRHLRLTGSEKLKLMDIGAGYGRFAHRFTAAFPASYVYCLDGVPESTFLCDFYIRFRGFGACAQSVPLSQLDRLAGPIDIAANIHSWSECTLAAINFWLDRVSHLNAKHLFVVPHTADFFTREKDGSKLCFLPAIEAHGYKLAHAEPKFSSSIMKEAGVYPVTYYLFQRV